MNVAGQVFVVLFCHALWHEHRNCLPNHVHRRIPKHDFGNVVEAHDVPFWVAFHSRHPFVGVLCIRHQLSLARIIIIKIIKGQEGEGRATLEILDGNLSSSDRCDVRAALLTTLGRAFPRLILVPEHLCPGVLLLNLRGHQIQHLLGEQKRKKKVQFRLEKKKKKKKKIKKN